MEVQLMSMLNYCLLTEIPLLLFLHGQMGATYSRILFLVELGFANGMVDDIFFVLGYDLKGSVVAQGLYIFAILGVHIYLHSDDVSMVDCPQGFGDASGERKPLCHAVTDVDGILSFKSIPCELCSLPWSVLLRTRKSIICRVRCVIRCRES